MPLCGLEKMMTITDTQVETYIDSLYQETKETAAFRDKHTEYPIIKKESARFLLTMLALKKPKQVLEIGTCVGFSSILMANYLPKAHITTIERYDKMIQVAKENFTKHNMEKRITLIEADAADTLAELSGPYDFIFLDAAKGQYLNFLPHILRLLSVDGMLISDNILQDGKIADKYENIVKRQRTVYNNMRKFLEVITHTNGLESSVLPIGDGIGISVKTKENILL